MKNTNAKIEIPPERKREKERETEKQRPGHTFISFAFLPFARGCEFGPMDSVV